MHIFFSRIILEYLTSKYCIYFVCKVKYEFVCYLIVILTELNIKNIYCLKFNHWKLLRLRFDFENVIDR